MYEWFKKCLKISRGLLSLSVLSLVVQHPHCRGSHDKANLHTDLWTEGGIIIDNFFPESYLQA